MMNSTTKILAYSSLLAIVLLIQSCSGCNKATKKEDDNKPLEWDVTGNLFKANSWIEQKNDGNTFGWGPQWLMALGINFKNDGTTDTKIAIVSASKENVYKVSTKKESYLNCQLGEWVEAYQKNYKSSVTPWSAPKPKLPNGKVAPNKLQEGEFALFNVLFGDIYLAVAPAAKSVKTLANTKEITCKLYYNMLVQAKKDGVERIVLHPVSAGKFAADGQEQDTKKKFTKNEFLQATFDGMKEGIAKFQQENPQHKLKIILNNWDQDGKNTENKIGKKIVEKVNSLN